MVSIEENLRYKSCNTFDLSDDDLDKPVYRVFPIERLIQLFNEKKNTLVKPAMWDDPFENILFQQTATIANGQIVHFSNIRECFYGQCWTLNKRESDALWRIYSPNKNGIRVKTTLRKLWDEFYCQSDSNAMISYYLGKIEYKSERFIKSFLENSGNLNQIIFSTDSTSVQTLFIKSNSSIKSQGLISY